MNRAVNTPPPEKLRGFLLGTLPLDENDEVASWVQSQPRAETVFNRISAQDTITLALAEPGRELCDPAVVRAVIQHVQRVMNIPSDTPEEPDRRDLPRTVEHVGREPQGAWSAVPVRLGDYRDFRFLARGGMGIVYEAVHDRLGRKSAVKVLDPERLSDPTYRERFFHEARIAASIRSDHIVTIYHVGEEENHPYLAMELLQGETLEDWLRIKGSPPTLPEVARIVRELLTGLAAAHAKGLIHRDIKPSNLWIEQGSGRLKILDFGLARATTIGDPRQGGSICGTPEYMSPEQTTGQAVDARVDLFSVGVVIHRMLTGSSPFFRGDMAATLAAVRKADPEPLRDVPVALRRFVERLLSKAGSGRPANAQVALDEWLAIEPELLSVRRRGGSTRSTWKIAAGLFASAVILSAFVFKLERDGDGQWSIELRWSSDESPNPRPTPVPSKIIGENARVRVKEYTQVFLDDSSNNEDGFVDVGDRGKVTKMSGSKNRCRVQWEGKLESWVSRDCLELE